jgi:hypothetical protein
VGCEVADEAFRMASLLGRVCRAARKEIRDCGTLLSRVHVEKEAVAVAMGAIIEGGWRLANALAGHRALRASIVAVSLVWSGEDEERWAAPWTFVAMSQLRTFGLGELMWSRSCDLRVRPDQLSQCYRK